MRHENMSGDDIKAAAIYDTILGVIAQAEIQPDEVIEKVEGLLKSRGGRSPVQRDLALAFIRSCRKAYEDENPD